MRVQFKCGHGMDIKRPNKAAVEEIKQTDCGLCLRPKVFVRVKKSPSVLRKLDAKKLLHLHRIAVQKRDQELQDAVLHVLEVHWRRLL